MNRSGATDSPLRQRLPSFEREARSAAKINYPNVAAVHRVGSIENETPFIIMEYIEGRNLADALQAEGVMTVEQACHTLRQVASALAAAHEKGIHRTESEVSGAARTKLRLLQAVGLILSFGLAGLVSWWVLGGGG